MTGRYVGRGARMSKSSSQDQDGWLGRFQRLDLFLVGIGIVAATIQLAKSVANESIVSFLFGALVLIPCAIWLFVRSHDPSIPGSPHYRRTFFLFFFIGFWVLFIIGTLMLYNQADAYLRPPGYLISIALMAGVLVGEVLCSSQRTIHCILPQIILLGLSVSWSQIVNFPGVVGMDPWFHQMFTNLLIEYHHLPLDYNYAHFPIFHLLIGQTAILTGFEYNIATLISVSLMQITCNVLFVYLFAVVIFQSRKIGALASLVVVLSPYHIYMSYWSIPNGFAAIFVVIALYLLFRRREGSWVFAMLIGLVLGTLILTHSISALCMIVVLFAAWGASVVYRKIYGVNDVNYIPFFIPVIFTVAVLAWWLLDAVTMETLVDLLVESFNFHYFQIIPAGLADHTLMLPVEEAYNNLGLYLPFFFSLIGIFSMISMKNAPRQFIAAFIGLAPFAITLSAFLVKIAIIPDRWFYFTGILLGGPLAVAILLVGGLWRDRGEIISLVVPIFIVTIFAFLAVTNPIADHWDPLISPNSTRNALFESEIGAFHTVVGISPSPIKTDRYYAESLKWIFNATVPFDDEIYSHDYSKLSRNLILVRSTVEDGPFTLYSVAYRLDYSLGSDLSQAMFSRVYDSQTVKGYLRQRGPDSDTFSGGTLPVAR